MVIYYSNKRVMALKTFYITLIFLLTSIGIAKSSDFLKSDEYWKGKKFYMDGNHRAAFDSWIKPAERGIPEAQFFIAGLIQTGQGVKKDFKKALKWYRSAAESGFSPAQLGMGNMIADGLGVKRNYLEAHKWFNIATANGNLRAQYNLNKIEQRMTSEEIKKAEKLAQAWLKKHPQKL